MDFNGLWTLEYDFVDTFNHYTFINIRTQRTGERVVVPGQVIRHLVECLLGHDLHLLVLLLRHVRVEGEADDGSPGPDPGAHHVPARVTCHGHTIHVSGYLLVVGVQVAEHGRVAEVRGRVDLVRAEAAVVLLDDRVEEQREHGVGLHIDIGLYSPIWTSTIFTTDFLFLQNLLKGKGTFMISNVISELL